MIVPQTGSIPSPINHHRGIYLYMMNYYTIGKTSTVTSLTLSKIISSNTCIIISVEYVLVKIETSLPIIFILCTETETILIEKEENMNKFQVKNIIYDYEVSSKPNVDIICIT